MHQATYPVLVAWNMSIYMLLISGEMVLATDEPGPPLCL